ncbi:polymer-forming cytoskeletal protein [Halostagnicola sp. A56]|uniref:bactofilin family protein n=1 Tax=Halostagnicola sp. A56 TaxID=1495067 RepID=UPI0004A13254|nr:polymer-forming cytoskeletal protein [Halostagnicola sp. A56]
MPTDTTGASKPNASNRSSAGLLARIAVLVAVLVLVVGSGPGLVAAQSVDGPDGFDGTVTVEEGESVDSVEAFAGNVIVDGTVTGDVSALAGNVYVNGEVEGDVSVASGNLEINGTVGGDVSAAAGNVRLAENGSVGGNFQAGGGTVLVNGTIDGDAMIGADTIELGETASISGDLEYSGDLQGETGVVEGEVTEDSSIGTGPDTGLEPIVTWVFALYTLALNLLLGAALLLLFPRFSSGVADRVANAPVRAGLVGLAVLIVVPIALIALAITVVGIPLSIIGGFVFALFVWIGIVYGRFAVAAWLLSLVGLDNRWLALVVGLVGGALLGRVPIVGGIVNFLIFLLGLGALAMTLYGGRRRTRESRARTGTGESTAD